MKSACQFALVFCLAAIMSPATSNAAEIPPISSAEHCTLEVSKMLDKAEQAVEYEKCMEQEKTSEAAVKKFWAMLPGKHQKHCLQYLFPPGKSYRNLEFCMSSSIGMACLAGTLSCEPK
jgi:hypothetical protein